MKTKLLPIFLVVYVTCFSQQKTPKLFIITIDGLRWQEIFQGADSSLIHNTKYVKDTGLIKQIFWHKNIERRKEKLFPFFWNVIARNGQLYGNRKFGNKVDVSNLYKISYPGYSELLTGYADPLLPLNRPLNNPNTNLLEYLNNMPEYKGQVVVFSSWDLFPYILNKKRNSLKLNSGYNFKHTETEGNCPIDEVQENIYHKGHTRYDQLTFLKAKEYIIQNHPKVALLSLGEADEAAHGNNYDIYLQKAKEFDGMVADLWYLAQTDPFYKDNITFLITTDHGRGKNENTWDKHNFFIKGSGEIWLALIGKNVVPEGEIKRNDTIYQKQLASTIALLLGQPLKLNHAVALPLKIKETKTGDQLSYIPNTKSISPSQ